MILQKRQFMFSNNQTHPIWLVCSSCCKMAMTYLLFLQVCLLDKVYLCLMKAIICVDNVSKYPSRLFSADVQSFKPKFCLFKFAKRLFHWKTIIILSLLYLCFLLLLHGDTESKLYPRNSKNHLPSFCQWNLNSLPEYNFAEMVFFKHMMLCI